MTIVCITRRRSFAAIHAMPLQSATTGLVATARALTPRRPNPGRHPERLPSLGLKLTSRTSSQNPAQHLFPQRRWRRWDASPLEGQPHRTRCPKGQCAAYQAAYQGQRPAIRTRRTAWATTQTHKIPRSPDKERGDQATDRGEREARNEEIRRSSARSRCHPCTR